VAISAKEKKQYRYVHTQQMAKKQKMQFSHSKNSILQSAVQIAVLIASSNKCS